ncbi:serine-repeat antigen [Lasiodiplodia theobromae]|nr:serine-repeat antigen [Lasiodiplodia theobromae]
MDARVIFYLAAFNAVAPGANAAPAPQGALQLNQPERREPQILGPPAPIIPGLGPLLQSPSVAVPALTPTQVNVNNPLGALASKDNGPAATAVTLPKELVQPVTNSLLQNPVQALQLAYTALLNALLGGRTSLLPGSQITPMSGVSNSLTSSLSNIMGPILTGTLGKMKKRQEAPLSDFFQMPEQVQPVDQPVDLFADQPVTQQVDQPAIQPVDQPVSVPSDQSFAVPSDQPVDQPITVPSDQPVDQPITVPSDQPVDQNVDQPITVPADQPVDLTVSQPGDVPVDQSIQPINIPQDQPVDIPQDQPVNVPTDQPIDLTSVQPVDQPAVQPMDQPAIQPVDQPVDQPSDQVAAPSFDWSAVQPVQSEEPAAQSFDWSAVQPVQSEEPAVPSVDWSAIQPPQSVDESATPSFDWVAVQPTEQSVEQPSIQPIDQPEIQPLDQTTELPIDQSVPEPTDVWVIPSDFPLFTDSLGQPDQQPTDAFVQPTSTDMFGFPGAARAGRRHRKRQVVPTTLITVPTPALVPSGITDEVAAIGSFAPLADATPLAAVPSSLAALAPNGGPASAYVPPVLASALADPDLNSLAAVSSIDPLAPLPSELVPPSAAAAASTLPEPANVQKRTVAGIAKSNGLKVRDVEELKAGLDDAVDPAAFVAQWIAAQAKPILNEIGNQMQAAPSILANIAEAQVSMAAAPGQIVAAQVSAVQPIIDAIPSIVESQLAAVPTAALPIFSAASSLLDEMGNATAATGNPLAALIPNPTAIASIIAEALPEVTATFDASYYQVSSTESDVISAETAGALVTGALTVGQETITAAAVQPVVASVTPLPTVYPTVGSSINLQSSVLQLPSPLFQLPSTLIPQPSSLVPPVQQNTPSIQQYPSVSSQDTNSAIGLVNVEKIAMAMAVPTSSTLPEVPEILAREDEPVDSGASNNNILDLLTQRLSSDGFTRLLENQIYLQLAPLFLMLQSLAAISNPTFTLSSLMQDLLGSSSSSSSSSHSNRILDLLFPGSFPAPSSPTATPSTAPSPANVVDDPIASAWLAGAKLLQSNSLVNTRLLSPNADGNNNNQLAGGVGGATAIISNLLNGMLSSSASASSELTRNMVQKLSALAKWSVDTQVAATRVGMEAWEELIKVLVS